LKAEAAVEKCRFRMIISHTAATISSHVLTHPVTLKEKKKEKKKAREIEGEKETDLTENKKLKVDLWQEN